MGGGRAGIDSFGRPRRRVPARHGRVRPRIPGGWGSAGTIDHSSAPFAAGIDAAFVGREQKRNSVDLTALVLVHCTARATVVMADVPHALCVRHRRTCKPAYDRGAPATV